MSLDWKCGELAEGLRCYCNQEFFLAHEHWETVWLTLNEPEKSFLQALIQTTAAFHHLKAGNPIGATSLLRRALGRIEIYSAGFGGIDVVRLRQEIRQGLHELEKNSAISLDYARICPIDVSEAPLKQK